MQLLTPQNFADYQLIDSGDYEKLERFGKYVLRRPEPQAVWRKHFPEKEWEKRTDAYFKKEKGKNISGEGNERGEWILKSNMLQQWFINYRYKDMKLRFRLGLTAFKHVGIFPEQASNWDFIYDTVMSNVSETPPDKTAKVLNLFAYTGGASLAAKAAGADVTHVDSVKQVLNWSRENMEASGLTDIRWVLEDALKFVKREAKRGKIYQGIILDPPAYGRGSEGEKWILEENIAELMEACGTLSDKQNSFCILNLYSMGFSSLIAENLIKDYFPHYSNIDFGELFLSDEAGKKLPLSVYCRSKI
ncbi:MAG: class I SAM-dependent methyltransferase [Dysgonamonadaceae bacterium]|jgi:23S rRNA (cytosine1962-C5)-methyltransferase|nr:class I SAM-dependent methyltransferase [Dysgonamonadaceae bacterium]